MELGNPWKVHLDTQFLIKPNQDFKDLQIQKSRVCPSQHSMTTEMSHPNPLTFLYLKFTEYGVEITW